MIVLKGSPESLRLIAMNRIAQLTDNTSALAYCDFWNYFIRQ